MCISENRGGHHGRLAIPKKFKKRRLVTPERTESANACTDAHKPPQVVEHHYHDHIRDQKSSSFHEEDTVELEKAHFPIKLHAILDHIEEDGHAHVISWQPHGRSFKVHKQDIFMKEILPEYFKLQRYASFQRQLNLCKCKCCEMMMHCCMHEECCFVSCMVMRRCMTLVTECSVV